MKKVYQSTILGLLTLAACSKPSKPAGAQTRGGMVMVPDTSETELRGRAPDQTGGILMMQAHLDSMARMSPAQMKRALPAHERMTSQLLEKMGQLPGAEQALARSVRQDLADLPRLSGPALSSRMQAHLDRVRRLLAMRKKATLGM